MGQLAYNSAVVIASAAAPALLGAAFLGYAVYALKKSMEGLSTKFW